MAEDYKTKINIPRRPVVLVILDGFGVNIKAPESTMRYAKRPTLETMEKFWPFTVLQASGIAVGLPWGKEGNSEVGHLTMGSGKVIFHHLPRIITAIQDGSFFENEALKKASGHVKEKNKAMHFMGLFSSGSVHAYVDHLYALLEFAKKEGLQKVYLHLFGDGRDAPVREMAKFLRQLEQRIEKQYPFAKIASVIGRDFSMDRDEDWKEIEVAYRLFVESKGNSYKAASIYVEDQYKKGTNDEFIEPAYLSDENNQPIGRIEDGDAVVFYNYRADSARELTQSFIFEDFDKFKRPFLKELVFVTMTEYHKTYPALVSFPPLDIAWPLARIISHAGLKQVHIAETDKYAHVTYFFNGGKEKAYPGEDRILVPSPEVANFDEVPEMSADKVTDAIIDCLGKYDVIIANFANTDMVGHTGNFSASIKAIEVVDFSIGKIIPKVLEAGGVLIVTADHGNVEEKVYQQTGERRTEHTANPVPFYLVAEEIKSDTPREEADIVNKYKKTEGVLTDISPTIVEILGLAKPPEMTGKSLLKLLTTKQ